MERRNMFFDTAMSCFLCGITMVVIAGVVLHAHIGMRNYRADICDGTGATLVIRPCGISGGRECGFTNVTVHGTGATAELRFPIHSPALLPAGGITRWFALVKASKRISCYVDNESHGVVDPVTPMLWGWITMAVVGTIFLLFSLMYFVITIRTARLPIHIPSHLEPLVANWAWRMPPYVLSERAVMTFWMEREGRGLPSVERHTSNTQWYKMGPEMRAHIRRAQIVRSTTDTINGYLPLIVLLAIVLLALSGTVFHEAEHIRAYGETTCLGGPLNVTVRGPCLEAAVRTVNGSLVWLQFPPVACRLVLSSAADQRAWVANVSRASFPCFVSASEHRGVVDRHVTGIFGWLAMYYIGITLSVGSVLAACVVCYNRWWINKAYFRVLIDGDVAFWEAPLPAPNAQCSVSYVAPDAAAFVMYQDVKREARVRYWCGSIPTTTSHSTWM